MILLIHNEIDGALYGESYDSQSGKPDPGATESRTRGFYENDDATRWSVHALATGENLTRNARDLPPMTVGDDGFSRIDQRLAFISK